MEKLNNAKTALIIYVNINCLLYHAAQFFFFRTRLRLLTLYKCTLTLLLSTMLQFAFRTTSGCQMSRRPSPSPTTDRFSQTSRTIRYNLHKVKALVPDKTLTFEEVDCIAQSTFDEPSNILRCRGNWAPFVPSHFSMSHQMFPK